MMDKVQKIREEVEKLHGNPYYMMAVKDVLEILDMQEEPVSNNYSALLPCIYNRTLEERVKYCKYCSAACEGRVKEPVGEDIEKEIDHAHKLFYEEVGWDSDEGARTYVADWFAYYFAKWQKERDQKSMEIMNEVYLKSCDKIRKQMIDKACEFLKDHLEGYDIFGSDIERSIESFKLAMKDET